MLNTTNLPLKPKYIILEKTQNSLSEQICDNCGRIISNVNLIKDTNTGETFRLGTSCTKKFTGKSLKEINEENTNYEKETKRLIREESINDQKKTFVKTFREINPEMLDFILKNQNNSFLKNMLKRIEETGTITNNMYSTILTMMLPVAELPQKFTNLKFKVLKFAKKEGFYGFSYTLFGEVNGGLIRIFFSSINEKHWEIFIKNKIIDDSGFIYDNIFERDIFLSVSGFFDGYKVKRAKISISN